MTTGGKQNKVISGRSAELQRRKSIAFPVNKFHFVTAFQESNNLILVEFFSLLSVTFEILSFSLVSGDLTMKDQ